MQRTAAILEDAKFPSQRSQVCMLQHGSALAVSRRSAMSATPPSTGNGTDLLQRPALLSSRSDWRALAAGGRPSHARGVGGHDDGIGVGRASSRVLRAPSRRYSPIDSSMYSMDAEQSLTASFNSLQDSIRMHSSEDLQTSLEEDHNITTQGVAKSIGDDIDRPSRISSRVHTSPHAVDADRPSTASLALKDNVHLLQHTRSAASSNRSAPSNREAVSWLSWKSPWLNGSKHPISTEGHVTVNATSLRDSMKNSLHLPASLRRSGHTHTENGGSPIRLVDAESALTASFSALQESIEMHPPMVLRKSPSRSSRATYAPAWISSRDAKGVSVLQNGTGTGTEADVVFSTEDASRSSKIVPLVNDSRHIMDAEAALTSSFTALENSIKTNHPLVLLSAPNRSSVTKHPGIMASHRDAVGKTPEQNARVSDSTTQGMDAEMVLEPNFSSLTESRQTYYALGMVASTNRNGGAKTEIASSSRVGLLDKSFQSRPPKSTSLHISDGQGSLKAGFNAPQDNIVKHDGLSSSSSSSLKGSSGARTSSKLGGSSQGLSLENLSMHLTGAEGALTDEFNSLADDAMMYHPSGLPRSRSRQGFKGALVGKHIREATRRAALVNGSSPSMDAENALKASFVALQNSIKIQHSLKWEHLDLQRKAKAAEWEATQTKAADERLLQQDMLIRQEDMRLRRQDEELRAENNQLQQLVSQLTKVDSEGRQVQQSSLASVWTDGAPEMSLLLSALLESRAGHAEVAENSSQRPADKATSALKNGSTTSNRRLEAAIRSPGSSKPGSRDARTERAIILGAGALGLFFAWTISHAAYFFLYIAKDENRDGAVDLADFEEHMAHRICCGLGSSAARGVLCVVIIAAAGFAFLWWQGIIQPFLKELVCYVYLGVVLLLLVGVILAELWGTFQDVFVTQLNALHRLMRFLKIDTGDINFGKQGVGKNGNEDSDNQRSNFGCC